jgi:uncharacterized UPF0160 family protein
MASMITIATHSGSFHSDDVFAVATLQLLHGVSNVHVVRTRDEAVLATADIVVDVGGVYDQSSRRFDHHQPGAPVRENGVPYAAFGLVWREYGEQLAGSKEMADEIEQKIVLAIDAGDTGMSLYTPNDPDIVPYELYQVVGSFHPVWGSEDSKDDAFIAAVNFARELLERLIKHKAAGVAMKELVAMTYEQTEDKRCLVFTVPVSAMTCIDYPEVLCVVCPDDPAVNQNWTVTTVRQERSSFEGRVRFSEAWGGLRGSKLATVSGIVDAVFCHKAGFIFVAGSKEGAVRAAGVLLGER